MTLAQFDNEHPTDQALLIAAWERKQEECPKCGRPRSVCSDPEATYYPQRTVCYADMARAWVQWKYDQLHGPDSGAQFHDGTFAIWSGKRTNGTPFEATDGVSLWVASEDLTPDDKFLDEMGGDDDGGTS